MADSALTEWTLLILQDGHLVKFATLGPQGRPHNQIPVGSLCPSPPGLAAIRADRFKRLINLLVSQIHDFFFQNAFGRNP